jgi:hypothetical protein
VTASTTVFGSTSQLNVGTSLLYFSGSAGNSGKSCRVTTVTGPVSGIYTYTVDNGGGSTGLSSAPSTSDVFTVDYGYGTNQVLINLPIIGPNVIISGSPSTSTVPLFFPTVTRASTSGGSFAAGTTYYVAITYTWNAGGVPQETMHGFIMSFAPGGATNTNTISIAGFTLPTGVTGANCYISTSVNGAVSTFKKQGTGFTIVSGVAQTLTLTANATATSSPPSVNPVAAAYPTGLSAAAILNNVGLLRFYQTPGITIENLYLYGNTGTNLNRGIQAGYCSDIFVGPNIIASSFGSSCMEFSTCAVNLNSTQADYSQIHCYNFVAFSNVNVRGGFNIALNAVNSGWVLQFQASFQTTNDSGSITTVGANQIVAYRCATGFQSVWGSTFRITTVTTNGQQTWSNTTAYNPTSGSVGNHNAYLEIN